LSGGVVTSVSSTRTADDGVTLFRRSWPVANPRAAVVLLHGLAEHSGRYEHVGSGLAERGFDVRSWDLRGFGASEGERAYVEDFDRYVRDTAVEVAEAAGFGVPVVLMGHSMGGLIATLYAQSDERPPDLLVLSTPSIDANIPRGKLLISKTLVRVVPRFRIPTHKITMRLGIALLDAMRRSREALSSVLQPTLVLHGGEDSIVPPEVSAPFEALDNVTRVVFDGFHHESFNEESGTLAISTVADWIDAQL
jgi:alpha-beta hydrolase superfamily lysophospholipase